MTKARIVIFTAFFIAFLLVGYAIAYQIRFRVPLPVANSMSATPAPLNSQQNLLVIHVDNLSKPKPTLISVWVVFFAEYDRPFVSFKSLYPDPLSPRPILPVTVLFSLDEEGAPSETFIKWIRDHQVEWVAYVLIDQEGLAYISDRTRAPGLDFIIPRNKDQLQAVWQQEAQLMNHLCKQLPPQKNKIDFDWDEVIPNHLHTNLSFEDAIRIWDDLESDNAKPNCEVFGLN